MILDTNVLIDIERRRFIPAFPPHTELTIAALTLSEFSAGIELLSGSRRAQEMRRFLETSLEYLTVLEYTSKTAAHHGRLLAETRRSGRLRDKHDLIIAAHAAETGRTIVSGDAHARFDQLGGVRAVDPGELLAE